MRFAVLLFCVGAVYAFTGVKFDNTYGVLHNKKLTYGPVWNIKNLRDIMSGDNGVCDGLSKLPLYGVYLCDNNHRLVNSESIFGEFDINYDILHNELDVSSVSAYPIEYNTPGPHDKNAVGNLVSGVLIVPNIPASKIRGVVLAYHPTRLAQNDVPSNFSDKGGLVFDKIMAAIYASQGYILVMPDYLGQGSSHDVMHPYVIYPDINAYSGLYMLKAAQQFLKQHLKINRNFNLYITGFSEGGAYAVWAAKISQGEFQQFESSWGLNLKSTVAISGAYYLTDVAMKSAFSDIDSYEDDEYYSSPGGKIDPKNQGFAASFYMASSKIVLASYLISSMWYYGFFVDNLDSVLQPEFLNGDACLNIGEYFTWIATMSKINISSNNCLINNKLYRINQLFMLPDLTSAQIANRIVEGALGSKFYDNAYFTGGKSYEELRASMGSGGYYNNSIASIVNYDEVMNEHLLNKLKSYDMPDWKTSSPLKLLYLKYDSVVSNLNSKKACEHIVGSTCYEIDNTKFFVALDKVPLYLDHGQSLGLLNIAALAEFKRY